MPNTTSPSRNHCVRVANQPNIFACCNQIPSAARVAPITTPSRSHHNPITTHRDPMTTLSRSHRDPVTIPSRRHHDPITTTSPPHLDPITLPSRPHHDPDLVTSGRLLHCKFSRFFPTVVSDTFLLRSNTPPPLHSPPSSFLLSTFMATPLNSLPHPTPKRGSILRPPITRPRQPRTLPKWSSKRSLPRVANLATGNSCWQSGSAARGDVRVGAPQGRHPPTLPMCT